MSNNELNKLADNIWRKFIKISDQGKLYIKLYIVFMVIGIFIAGYIAVVSTNIVIEVVGKPVHDLNSLSEDQLLLLYEKLAPYIILVAIYGFVMGIVLTYVLYTVIIHTYSLLKTLYENYNLIEGFIPHGREEISKYIDKVYRSRYILHLYILSTLIAILFITVFLKDPRHIFTNMYISSLIQGVFLIIMFKLIAGFFNTYADLFNIGSAWRTFLLYVFNNIIELINGLFPGEAPPILQLLSLILLILYLVSINSMFYVQ